MNMKIEIDSSLMQKIGVDESEVKELLAIALYKYKGIHGSMAGRLIGKMSLIFTRYSLKEENL